jgi:hypothetical protein
MDAKSAVELAKNHITDLFAQEGLVNLGLEEVDYDDVGEQWRITVGFSRSWDNQAFTPKRTYKVVTIDKNGRALSVKNRETADAG